MMARRGLKVPIVKYHSAEVPIVKYHGPHRTLEQDLGKSQVTHATSCNETLYYLLKTLNIPSSNLT